MLLSVVPPPRMPRLDSTLALSLLLSAVIAIGGIIYVIVGTGDVSTLSHDHTTNNIQFAPLVIDTNKLDKLYSAQKATYEKYADNRDLKQLYELVQLANSAQFPSHKPMLASLRGGLDQNIRLVANEVVLQSGIDQFMASGHGIFAKCETHLVGLLDAIQSHEIKLDEALSDPSNARFEDYRAYCGNALKMLYQHGLINDHGQWSFDDAIYLFNILQRLRWGYIIQAHKHAEQQLSPYEYRVLMRWRIEDPNAYSVDQRLKFLSQAENNLADYDGAKARQILQSIRLTTAHD